MRRTPGHREHCICRAHGKQAYQAVLSTTQSSTWQSVQTYLCGPQRCARSRLLHSPAVWWCPHCQDQALSHCRTLPLLEDAFVVSSNIQTIWLGTREDCSFTSPCWLDAHLPLVHSGLLPPDLPHPVDLPSPRTHQHPPGTLQNAAHAQSGVRAPCYRQKTDRLRRLKSEKATLRLSQAR